MRLNIIFSTITLSLLILSFPFVTNADTIKIENAGALVGMVANISEDLNNDDSELVAQDIAEGLANSNITIKHRAHKDDWQRHQNDWKHNNEHYKQYRREQRHKNDWQKYIKHNGHNGHNGQ